MNCDNTDIVICGGGISGLIMAKSLIHLGLRVTCIEKNERKNQKFKNNDLRSTALLYPAIDFFKKVGIWKNFVNHAQPLNSLVICNLNPKSGEIDSNCEFLAEDLEIDKLGYNLPNKIIISELQKLMMTTKKFRYLEGDYVEHIKPRSFDVVIKTNKRIQISSKLIIAADGRNSNIREISKIKKIKYDYNQKALVFNIKHEYNHDSKSYEIYKSEGPCTLVPLKTKQFNGYFSSVVLMLDDKNNTDKIFVDKKGLSDFITKRTGNILGSCKVQSEVSNFSIISQASLALSSERIILLAESAHVLPPIGAQGLNTSIHDIKNLYHLVEKRLKNKDEIGNFEFVKEYENLRKKQISSRMLSVHLLNKLSISKKETVSDIRKFGLSFLSNNQISKKIAMRFGMFQ